MMIFDDLSDFDIFLNSGEKQASGLKQMRQAQGNLPGTLFRKCMRSVWILSLPKANVERPQQQVRDDLSWHASHKVRAR